MKKHLVILVGAYKPYMSPNGRIIAQLVKSFSEAFRITVLARKTCFGLPDKEYINGEQIFRIGDMNEEVHAYCSTKLVEKTRLNPWYRCLLLLKRGIFFISRICRSSSVSSYFCHKIRKALNKIDHEDRIDLILAASAPHEEVHASIAWGKENSRDVFVFQMDRFVNANSLYPLKALKALQRAGNVRLEKIMLDTSKMVFVLPPIFEYYKQHDFETYRKKIMLVEHPLVMERTITATAARKNGVIITYAGSLDQKLRNPSFLLQVLSTAIIQNSSIQANFYSFGNCEEMIARASQKRSKSIKQMGKVDSKTIEEKLSGSDILLTIGNNSDSEVPSKLFEYLSYGKPIIHFFYSDKDKYLEYLARYPMALCIKIDVNKAEEAANQIVAFANLVKGQHICNSTVRQLYKECTPEYVAHQMIRTMNQ